MVDESIAKWNAAVVVRHALKGDPSAAQEILMGFADAVAVTHAREWPAQLPRIWALYLAKAFRRIVEEQADPHRALHLKGSKSGRRKGAHRTHDDVRLAAAYWLMRRGSQTPERANELLREATGADRRTIQKAAGGSCAAFEDKGLYSNRLLRAIALEQSSLAALIGRYGPADEAAE